MEMEAGEESDVSFDKEDLDMDSIPDFEAEEGEDGTLTARQRAMKHSATTGEKTSLFEVGIDSSYKRQVG